ncbi:hypothetical protein [Streptomyces filamentosus]|uniref:hypothetical protein n=1 Tax=Streptomyces filamentosus TaxID=67294 RepID=UPI0033E0B699
MERTHLLKELSDAVDTRNGKALALRNASAHVTELTVAAIAAGAPGSALRKILARMEPVAVQERPHECGQLPVAPPLRTVPPQPFSPPPVAAPDGPVRYTLNAAHREGILPWTASTMRTYFKRSRERGIPLPAGERSKQSGGRVYTAEEPTAWLERWRVHQKERDRGAREGAPAPDHEAQQDAVLP